MKFETLIDVIQKAAATFALIVGGYWVLRNYVRNRTHVPRLQVELKAKIIECGNQRYLLALMQVKNPGLSRIIFPEHSAPDKGPYGSALQVWPLIRFDEVSDVIECDWEEYSPFEVLVNHDFIEPGLVIFEEKLLRVPDKEYDAFRLRLRVLVDGERWSADAIAIPPSKSEEAVNS